MTKQVKINQYSDSQYWYSDYVGETFPLISENLSNEEFIVVAADGYSNIVLKTDGEIIDT